MAGTQSVKLVVEDADGATVVNDNYDGVATGDQIFRAMNSKCVFREWSLAEALGPHVKFTVMNSRDPRHNEAHAKRVLQDIIDSLARMGAACEFTFKVWKNEESRDPNADSPEGPEYALNPGLGPKRNGPDYGGYETPAGPGASLDRMRGTLARVYRWRVCSV